MIQEKTGAIHGFSFRITVPALQLENNRKKQRYSVTAYIYYSGLRKAVIQKRYRAPTGEAAFQSANKDLEQLIRSSWSAILIYARNKEIELTIDSYLFLRLEEIYRHSASSFSLLQLEKIWALKDTQRFLATHSIWETIHTSDAKAYMNELLPGTSDQASKRRSLLYSVLDDTFSMAIEDGLTTDNPFHEEAAMHRRSQNEIISSRMSRNSLSEAELIAATSDLFNGVSEGDSIAAAQLLRLLLGLTPAETCGLDWSAWERCPEVGVSWLASSKEFYQEKGKPPTMRYMLSNINRYRRVPCTSFVEWLLATVHSFCSTNRTAIFEKNGFRLTPNELKAATIKTLDQFMADGGALSLPSRKMFGSGDSRQVSATDIFRHSTEFHGRYNARIPESWIDVFLGRSPSETYARDYVTWTDPNVLKICASKLEALHLRLLAAVTDRASEFPTQICSGYSMIVQVNKQSSLHVSAEHGVQLQISKLQK